MKVKIVRAQLQAATNNGLERQGGRRRVTYPGTTFDRHERELGPRRLKPARVSTCNAQPVIGFYDKKR